MPDVLPTVRLSENDYKLYQQVAQHLHSLLYILTDNFLRGDKTEREQITSDLKTFYEAMSRGGCGMLCYSKERGCYVCTYDVSKPGKGSKEDKVSDYSASSS